MLFERIESEGLAHYSYLIGHAGRAVVIDPRRDCEIYAEKAAAGGYRIMAVLETHRNEDYCTGSVALASLTGAEIWHADPQLEYRYGRPVAEGQTWQIGGFTLYAMYTPGHTPGSVTYVLLGHGDVPWMAFTGDTLFAGDVGRTDLLGEAELSRLSSQLYHSIYDRILPLGDGTLLFPAHGPGSVCGNRIADRSWTTVGLEKMLNPMLRYREKESFIAAASKMLERPPYFLHMEKINLEGAPLPGSVLYLPPLSPAEFHREMSRCIVVDTRSETAFSATHIPGAISLWPGGLSGYAGWFLPYDKPLLLVVEDNFHVDLAVRKLLRMGYDNLVGYLAGGMTAWHRAGYQVSTVKTATVYELCTLLDTRQKLFILDVRRPEEHEQHGRIPGACHIPLTELPGKLPLLPHDQEIFIFCASGLRSMVAASLMLREGFNNLTVVLGGFTGWNSVSCPLVI